MKKKTILILTSFLSALLFSLAPVLAAGKVKVYYSESLGTGEKVYRMTTCEKVPAMGVVNCTEELKGHAYGTQCDEDKDKGNPIYGCLKRTNCEYTPGGSGDICTVPGTAYGKVDVDKYAQKKAQGGCSDEPDDKAPLYGQLYALVPNAMSADNFDESKISGKTVMLEEGDTGSGSTPQVSSYPDGLKPRRLYQTGLCATWDKPEGGSSEDPPADVKKLLCKINAAGDAAASGQCDSNPSNWSGLADQTFGLFGGDSGADCNTSLNTSKLDHNKSASCTYVERITGDNGADIIGKYIGMLYKWAAGIIGIVAVLGIVYSGIQMSVAAGNTALVDEAKSHIGKALIAIAILFLSGLILYTINPTFFTGG